jgi:hypothetical protein
MLRNADDEDSFLSPVQLMLFMAQVSRQHSCNISGKVQWRHLPGTFELWAGTW